MLIKGICTDVSNLFRRPKQTVYVRITVEGFNLDTRLRRSETVTLLVERAINERVNARLILQSHHQWAVPVQSSKRRSRRRSRWREEYKTAI